MFDASDPKGAIWSPKAAKPAYRSLCTDCGLSRTDRAKDCGRACQFIAPDYPSLEVKVHGRRRSQDPGSDERFFGPFLEMHRAALRPARDGAQWTGITTRLAEKLLETGGVDAVLTMVPHPEDKWRPRPAIITEPGAMAAARGMRMGYAPLLSLMAPAKAAGHRRLAVIGIPCQVYALRALEAEWGFEKIFVIGTPCSDNTTTERFHEFLALLTDRPEAVTYFEFRADYHVEMRFDDAPTREIPFLKLPIADLPDDFFPVTCRTCVDYTNTLADITVGYMGGQGAQWLIVRNATGRALLASIRDELDLSPPGSRGRRHGSVKGFLENTARAAGGLPLRRMPNWMRGIMGWLMPRIGPRGLEFARTRVEMKAIETVLHLRRSHPRRMRSIVPGHVWKLVAPYGLTPQPGETPDETDT